MNIPGRPFLSKKSPEIQGERAGDPMSFVDGCVGHRLAGAPEPSRERDQDLRLVTY